MIVIAIIGILAAIAIPNFLKFQARAKQGEAKANLKAWFTTERAYAQEKDIFSEDITVIGFSPERGNRYHYRFSAAALSNQPRNASGLTTGSFGGVEADTFRFAGSVSATYTAKNNKLTYVGTTPASPGISGPCPSCEIDGFAAGNIDNDPAGVDTWVISTKDGVAAAGCGNLDNLNVPAGNPYNTHNDVDCD